MRSNVAWWLFWGALGLIAYTYVGYPLLLVLRGLLRPRAIMRGAATPTVSVPLLAATVRPLGMKTVPEESETSTSLPWKATTPTASRIGGMRPAVSKRDPSI